jgi:hypothetical protein
MRALTSDVSSSSCLSAVVRKGNDEAMKSARRPGSSMLIGEGRRRGDDLLELADDVPLHGLDLGGDLGRALGDGLVLGGHERGQLDELAQAHALGAFGEDEEALVGHLDDLMDGRAGAYGVEIGAGGGVLAGIALGDDQDGLALPERLDELDGAFAADGQGQDGVGKEDRISNRENGERAPIRGTGGGLVGLFSASWADDTDKVIWH